MGEDEDEEKDEEKADGEKKEEKKDKKDEESLWLKFWKEFNKNLKMGCYEDDSNRSKLSKLLLFMTTKSEGKEINLDKFLDRMQESQESIYYMYGESIDVMQKAPALQIFKKKDIEVLMLTDHLDEPCIQKLADYEGKKFVSIQKADVKLDETEEEKKRFSKLKDMYKPLTDWQQEKVMKAQSFQNKDQISMMSGRKALEVNANHPVVVDLLSKVKADKEDKAALDTAQVLFQTALI